MVQAALAALSDKQVSLLNKFQSALALADVAGYLKSLAGALAPGVSNVNVLNLSGNVADGETVTIGGKVYEFDPSANGVVAGHIAVSSADATRATATPALVAAINANDTRITAVSLVSDAVVLIYEKEPAGNALTCSEAMTNGAWTANTMYGGLAVAVNPIVFAARVPKTGEVTAGKMHFVFDRPPTAVVALEIPTAGGAVLGIPAASVASAGNVTTITNSGTDDFTTGQLVVVIATLA